MAEHEKRKMRFRVLQHFPIARAIEKWRGVPKQHIRVAQEFLHAAEIPYESLPEAGLILK
ncbi:MAG TPA: hypothetical protein VKB27_16560 [Gammaproteobacteria bacterium]|nr:hypothetical protein [Gammaproteobacteria bacterium]